MPYFALSSRGLIAALALAAVSGPVQLALGERDLRHSARAEAALIAQMDPSSAHRAAQDQELLLLDIRRPEEWAASGTGEGAVRLDMRRPDFVEVLLELTGGDAAHPIGVICATGVRSAAVSDALAGMGFTGIVNVPEGMMGSDAGPGWLARGLPVVQE